jgi:4-hydroxy-4-methyl-2-oxoglutarate aldolase
MTKYETGPMPPPLEEELLELLLRVETSTIGHWRHWGICHPRITSLTPGSRAAGAAITLMAPAADSTMMHYAISRLRPGDIFVVDRLGDDRYACVGGVVAFAAKARGASAIVIDGPCTDIDEIRAQGLPVWCCGASALTTKRLDLGGRLNVPVSVGGVVVMPGDAVLCDDNGVVVLPVQDAKEEGLRAILRQEGEAALLEQLRVGTPLGSITGAEARVNDSKS